MTIEELNAKAVAVRQRHGAANLRRLDRRPRPADEIRAESIAAVLRAEMRSARKIESGLSELVGYLTEHEPKILAAIRGFRYSKSGVLTLVTTDSSNCWTLDNWARSGGLLAARAVCTCPVNRIHVKVEVA